jgi:hypothetical protein
MSSSSDVLQELLHLKKDIEKDLKVNNLLIII